MTSEKKKSGREEEKRTKSSSTGKKRSKNEKSRDGRRTSDRTKSEDTKESGKKDSSPQRQKSQSSPRKPKKSGLSPPPSSLQSLPGELINVRLRSESNHCLFFIFQEGMDVTQWENTPYKDEATGNVVEDPNEYVVDKVGEGTPFLTEQKQVMLQKGEHLFDKPMYTLFFLFVELILGLTVLVSWSFFLDSNEFTPILFCFANIIIIIIVILILFVIQFGRFNVIKEELDEDFRYRIPYHWKYWICVLHFLRFFLICSNISIAALDNDFDGGTITMVSAMPVMLILSAGHVFFALKPQ
ncbi:hypothetical protein CRE_03771 [Caenorhabditis remanei]|uniref:Uncharacterized protein n=1 Tax=Caenorhabditis remanei TaxID=31234 RepID=E3LY70_CAERE|nr:hypothetical protein CRE_03771 [Caenorhabditis remanei]